MKKLLSVLLIIGICALLGACAKDDGIVEITTNQPVSSTKSTAPPVSNEEMGAALKETLVNQLDSAEITGELEYGKFTYSYNRDPKKMYAYERDEAHESLAKDAADELVKSISRFYEDEITLYQFNAVEIGSGEGGLDSVRYEFCYTDSSYRQLNIYCDSDGMISYVNCDITW